MITIDEVWAKKIVVFDNARLPISEHPLTLIRGRNLDRRKAGQGLHSANAVGKSLMYSIIPTVRYFAPPTSTKKKSAKEIHAAGSAAGFAFQRDGKKYTVEQYTKGKSIGLNVTQNGKPIKFRTKNGAIQKMEALLPQSQQLFYSISYLDSRNNNPLQRGTDAERFAFFEDLFQLDIYDHIFKELTAEYNRLKTEVAQLRTLQQEFSERESELPRTPQPKLVKLHKKLRLQTKEISAKVEKQLRELQHLSVYLALAEGLENINLAELDAKIKEIREDEADLQSKYEDAVDYYSRLELYNDSQERRRKLIAKIEPDRLLPTSKTATGSHSKKRGIRIRSTSTSISSIEDTIAEQSENRSRLRSRIEKAIESNEHRDNLDGRINDLGIDSKWAAKADKYTSKTLRAAIMRDRDTIKRLEESKEALEHNHEAKECPVCLSKLDKSIIKKLIRECNDGIDKANAKIKRLKQLAEYKELKEQLDACEPKINVKALKEKYKECTDKIAKLKEQLAHEQQQQKWIEQLEALPKMKFEKRDKSTKPIVYKETLKDVRKELEALNSVRERLIKLGKLEKKYESHHDAKARHDMIQASIEKHRPVLDKMQESINKVSSQLAKSETISEDLKRLSAKISELKHADKDFKIYEALRKAYGAKGLRKLRMRELGALLEANLNDYAHLVFGEPITFKINITDTTFSILADRNRGKVSDVRMLSKSESRFFVLLLFRSLIPFIPAHKRYNFIVLDEMEDGMDEHSKQKYVEEYIPEIMKIVPNVVIITAESTKGLNVNGAHTIIVEKNKGVSKLVHVKSM